MPHINGSTTVCASAHATAASTALPPIRKISTPDSAASGWGHTTIPCLLINFSLLTRWRSVPVTMLIYSYEVVFSNGVNVSRMTRLFRSKPAMESEFLK